MPVRPPYVAHHNAETKWQKNADVERYSLPAEAASAYILRTTHACHVPGWPTGSGYWKPFWPGSLFDNGSGVRLGERGEVAQRSTNQQRNTDRRRH